MTGVEIDEEAGRARVLAGTLSRDVMNAAAGCGKAALCGSSPDVGMVGYTLGGGIGWLGRKHGIQANALTAVELVTADGELVRADGENEADLFWALRGGGGNFGVITAIEFDLMPVAEAYAGMLAWPWERSEEVLKAWAEWAPGAPDEITTSARILQFPPIPEIPDFLRGRNLVMIDGAHCGSAEDAEEELRPFRELGPELDMWGTMPTPGLVQVHGDPEQPTPAVSDHCMLRELPPEAVEAFVGISGPGSGSPLLFSELRQFGGAIGRPPQAPSAIGSLSDPFGLFALGLAMDPDGAKAASEHAAKVRETMDALGGRAAVLQLRRAARRRRGLLRGGRLRAPARGAGQARSRRDVPGEPRARLSRIGSRRGGQLERPGRRDPRRRPRGRPRLLHSGGRGGGRDGRADRVAGPRARRGHLHDLARVG